MRLTPRKEEIDGVREMLENDEYATADQMAKALIKEIADMPSMRDWFALTHVNRDG